MSPKKFLSEKKTSAQTISISPALKDWIESYVRKMREENPEDERYNSYKLQDDKVEILYGKMSAPMLIHWLEGFLEYSKCIPMDVNSHMRFFFAFKDLLFCKTKSCNG